MSKLTLGTVQLGLAYGVNNTSGKPSIEKSLEILDFAYKKEILSLDTASAYGDSESIIGKFLKNKKINVEITSKLPTLPPEIEDLNEVRDFMLQSLSNSLNQLSITVIDNYLVHNLGILLGKLDIVIQVFKEMKKNHLIKNYGFSIYDLKDLEILSKYEFDVIQIPASIFNQSIINSSLLSKLKLKGVTVYVRSVFLQGLLFFKPNLLPVKLKQLEPYLRKLIEYSTYENLAIDEIAFKFIQNHKNTDYLVFGVDNIEQLKRIVSISTTEITLDNTFIKSLTNIPVNLTDPRNW